MSNMYTLPSGEEVEIDKDNFIETQIVVGLSEAVDNDLEGWLDYISDQVTGTPLLSDFTYGVAGVTNEGMLILKVSGYISMILADEEDYS